MTELLYYDDAYLREFDATVTAVETTDGKTRVALDRTAFYPGGGGQPNDEGWLTIDGTRARVVKVGKGGGEVWHTLATDAPVPATGATVHGELDWDRRYALMRTHTAMHILCGVVWRDYEASVTGGNMEPGKGRMDFEFASLTREMISEIEAKCNVEIAAAHPTRTQTLPRGSVPDPGPDPHQDQPVAAGHPGGAHGGVGRAGLAGRRRDARREYVRGRADACGGL